MVGIFVNQPVDEVVALASACGLDYVQLSGEEDAAYCRAVWERSGRAVIKTLRLGGPQSDGAEAAAEAYAADGGVAILHADAAVDGAWGGTGQAWDWRAAAGVAARYPLLVAGGLRPDNVRKAVAAVRPWGVDVASGVETGGVTDAALVRLFIARAKGVEQWQ
jgi:phosphoribosylanthranilate isomerase